MGLSDLRVTRAECTAYVWSFFKKADEAREGFALGWDRLPIVVSSSVAW